MLHQHHVSDWQGNFETLMPNKPPHEHRRQPSSKRNIISAVGKKQQCCSYRQPDPLAQPSESTMDCIAAARSHLPCVRCSTKEQQVSCGQVDGGWGKKEVTVARRHGEIGSCDSVRVFDVILAAKLLPQESDTASTCQRFWKLLRKWPFFLASCSCVL